MMQSSCYCRSAPEFGAQQQQGRNSLLRKTQSQPQPQGKGKSKDKKKGKKGASKNDHGNLSGSGGDIQDNAKSRSYPNPLSLGSGPEGTPPPDGANAKHQDLERKTSCPTSPTSKDGDKPKLENKKTAPGALGGGAGGGSPKPKRNIFDGLKNTLRPKSKSQDNSSSNSSGGAAITGASAQTSNSATAGGVSRIGGVSGSSQVYANMHSMPELNVAVETGESPETSSGANSHDRKSSGGSVMTSSATQEADTTTSAVSH